MPDLDGFRGGNTCKWISHMCVDGALRTIAVGENKGGKYEWFYWALEEIFVSI